MKKFLGFAVLIQIACMWFMYAGSQKSERAAQTYKAERDSLLVAHDCPPKMIISLPTSKCLNPSEKHDFDRQVMKLALLCGDTLRTDAFCQSCYSKLSGMKKAELLAPLLENFLEQERKMLLSGARNE